MTETENVNIDMEGMETDGVGMDTSLSGSSWWRYVSLNGTQGISEEKATLFCDPLA